VLIALCRLSFHGSDSNTTLPLMFLLIGMNTRNILEFLRLSLLCASVGLIVVLDKKAWFQYVIRSDKPAFVVGKYNKHLWRSEIKILLLLDHVNGLVLLS